VDKEGGEEIDEEKKNESKYYIIERN